MESRREQIITELKIILNPFSKINWVANNANKIIENNFDKK